MFWKNSAWCMDIIPLCTSSLTIDVTASPVCVLMVVPRLLSAFFCVLLRIEISLLENWYPPAPSTFGRYLVFRALRVFWATSCCSFDMLSCLLLCNAILRQLSMVRTRCAFIVSSHAINIKSMLVRFILYCGMFWNYIYYYLNAKLREPIMFPSAKMLT